MYHSDVRLMRLVSIALMTAAFGNNVNAAFIINISQQGNDVIATGSGECNISSLTNAANGHDLAFISPQYHGIYLGPASYDPELALWGAINGPSNFGIGGSTTATSGTGSIVGISDATLGLNLAVPYGYVSGTFFSATAFWADQTVNSLGIEPGSYTWTWGSGLSADFLTLNAAVPEPESIGLLATTIGVCYILLRRAKYRTDH